MTSVEIEDVLSSIRRLVTEDLRPKPMAVDEKLILTPALRVVPDVVATRAAPSADQLDVDLDADLAQALRDEVGLQDQTAQTDADTAVSGTFPMFLHHASRVDLAQEPFAADLTDAVTTIGAGIPADGYEAELGDVMAVPEWPESSWVAPEVIDGVEEAELIAVPETSAESYHEDWASEDAPAQPDLSADILHGTADDDAAEAAALAALAADDAAQEAAALTELDEDMLRDIVRDIIREELHGSLGERITRSVRKLVRSEINRAMMTQDLD